MGSRWVRYPVTTAGILFIIRVGVIDDSFSEAALGVLVALAMLLIGFFALAVISFGIYHYVKHGNFFMQDAPDPISIRHFDAREKKSTKKFCPVCKRVSSCRLGRNPYTGMKIHVIRS